MVGRRVLGYFPNPAEALVTERIIAALLSSHVTRFLASRERDSHSLVMLPR